MCPGARGWRRSPTGERHRADRPSTVPFPPPVRRRRAGARRRHRARGRRGHRRRGADETRHQRRHRTRLPSSTHRVLHRASTPRAPPRWSTTSAPNAGRGYLRLTTLDAADHATVFAEALRRRRKLADITDLAFETYVEQAGTGNDQAAPAINIPIFPNKAGIRALSRTLVWEPTYTGAQGHAGPVAAVDAVDEQGRLVGDPHHARRHQAQRVRLHQLRRDVRPGEGTLPDALVLAVGVNQGSGSHQGSSRASTS